jgi:DNA-binding transcriptional MocR family regulator
MGMNQVRIIYRRKRRTFNKKQLEALYRSFDQGRKPPELSKELGRSISTVYRHYKLWNEQSKVEDRPFSLEQAADEWKRTNEWRKTKAEEYVAAIGPDKPSVDWAAVGNALIQLGRAFGGIHPV